MALRERHRSERIGWLRAAVLGANDGIVSTASLVVGVAAAEAARHDVLVAGMAGLVAGALSMAAGEYVSVSSQADTEKADLTLERHELATEPKRRRRSSPASTSSAGWNRNSLEKSRGSSRPEARWPHTRATSSASPKDSPHGLSRPRSHRQPRSRSGQECPS